MSLGLIILITIYCSGQFFYFIGVGIFFGLGFGTEYEDKNAYYTWSFMWIKIYKSNTLNRFGKIFLETVYSIFFLPTILIGFIVIVASIGVEFIFKKLFYKKEKGNEGVCD